VNKSVVHAHQEVKRRRSEERDFALNFSQIRNMIAKQTKAGEMIKIRTHNVRDKKEQARQIRNQE
jgi:hypothetical protein